ncbi:45414_t:CDS:2 [Gigaspora margarita]|uniref:45414_t:CDS:1 n=1 Tax=Gigaspora margarita TaxID=4874 RepID=A0ABN7UAV9_GIGMA|nr:45414_t:CDS:2 [Gigaspora margarita]
MDPRNVEYDNCSEQEEDCNQTSVNSLYLLLDKIIKWKSEPRASVYSRVEIQESRLHNDNQHNGYRNKTTKVPILTNSRSPIEVVKELSESKRTFDEFEYEDKALKEAEEFYTEEISDDNIFCIP